MKSNSLKQLKALGQSIWLDYIRRDLIEEDGLRGMTSNPSIFEKAIVESHDDDRDIRSMALEGKPAKQIYKALSDCDVQSAADRSQDINPRACAKLMRPVTILLGALALFVPGAVLSAATVEYDLTIARQERNFTGHPVKAMTINGQLPGPTLRFTDGDHAVIRVHNRMDVETSIHWHGILLPNAIDGVPFVTYPPIEPGGTFTYEFDLGQSGTYWYHSHTMLQEQRGLFGALVIAPKSAGEFDGLRDHVAVLSDWTDEDANSVLHTLKRGSEWYSIRKGSGQSVLGAARLGLLGAYFSGKLRRMPPMDIADVYYDRFLLNGAPQQSLAAEPGERIRLRIIDGSATTFFYLQCAGGLLQVIAADGQLVQPFDEERLLVGVAETYDVIVTVPAEGSYEFRATAHDGSGRTSLWIGDGTRHAAPDIPFPNLYVNMGGLSLKRLFALTPGGSMGMPGNAVRAGKFDQPGMNGMKEMDHSSMTGMAPKHAGHDMSGMARVVHYQDFAPDPATAAVRPELYRDPFNLYGRVDALSQMAQGALVYANSRHIFSAEWQAGWQRVDDVEWEVTPAYDYCLNRFASVFAGVDLAGAGDHFDKHEGIFGVRYLLPLNITSRVLVDTAGEFQFAVGKHLELTPRLAAFSEAEYDTKEHWEIRAGTSYLLTRNFSLIGQWHSPFGWGGGLRWQFRMTTAGNYAITTEELT